MQKPLRAKTVGIRELRLSASKILRRVREKGEAIDITYRGQVIARIVPTAPAKPDPQILGAIWTDLDRVAEEVGRRWPAGLSAAEAVSAERR